MRGTVILGLIALFVTGCMCTQTVPITPTYDGLTIGHKNAPVHIEAFYDLVCPASQAANDQINILFTNQTFAQYLPNIAFTYHIFPLPYHDYSFSFGQLYRLFFNSFDQKTIFDYINFVFEIQEDFYNDQTEDYSRNNVYGKIAKAVNIRFPQVSIENAVAAMTNRTYDLQTRYSWKYGCSREVSGTPTFFLNGVALDGASGFSSKTWAATLLPYLQNAVPQSEVNIQDFYKK